MFCCCSKANQQQQLTQRHLMKFAAKQDLSNSADGTRCKPDLTSCPLQTPFFWYSFFVQSTVTNQCYITFSAGSTKCRRMYMLRFQRPLLYPRLLSAGCPNTLWPGKIPIFEPTTRLASPASTSWIVMTAYIYHCSTDVMICTWNHINCKISRWLWEACHEQNIRHA